MSQNPLPKDGVWELLKTIKYPGYSRDIVSFGMVKDVRVEDNKLTIQLVLQGIEQRVADGIKEYTLEILRSNSGYEQIQVDAEVTPPRTEKKVSEPHAAGKPAPQPIAGIDRVLVVSSGKGGVGKSTVAVNLAVTAAKSGQRIGIMDADIHGPSLPTLLGVDYHPEAKDNRILPIEKFGIRAMSIGFIIESGQPLIWRGPMLNKALEQIMDDTVWGDLDMLIVDLPPGTGDVQISMAQKYKIDGAIVVTTPQNLALEDVTRGAVMFKTTDVPVLGIVENMSYYRCPQCGHLSHPFGEGGGKREAAKLGLPLLGELPMDPQTVDLGDRGEPIAIAAPESESAKSYQQLWNNISEHLKERS